MSHFTDKHMELVHAYARASSRPADAESLREMGEVEAELLAAFERLEALTQIEADGKLTPSEAVYELQNARRARALAELQMLAKTPVVT